MCFKDRELRGWIYIDLFSGVPHAVWKQLHIVESNSFFLLVIQACRFSVSTGLIKIGATAPEVNLAVVSFYYMSHIFIFIPVRGILILVIQIPLHSYRGLQSQASNNSLSQQNWSINKRHPYSTISNASKYTPIKNYGGACKIEPCRVSDSWGTGELDPSSYNWIRIPIFHSVLWRKDVFIWKPSTDIQKTTVQCSNCQKLLFSEWILRVFKVCDGLSFQSSGVRVLCLFCFFKN